MKQIETFGHFCENDGYSMEDLRQADIVEKIPFKA